MREKKDEDFKFNDRQKKFYREYLVDLNATRAAKRAGYSENSASSTGCELLKKPKAKEYIDFLKGDLEKLSGCTALRNLKELSNLAFTEIGDILEDWKTLKDFSTIPENRKKLIQEVKIQETARGTSIQVKFANRLQAIDMINKMLGYYAPEKVQGDTTISFKD